jgi:hypothetical protein
MLGLSERRSEIKNTKLPDKPLLVNPASKLISQSPMMNPSQLTAKGYS